MATSLLLTWPSITTKQVEQMHDVTGLPTQYSCPVIHAGIHTLELEEAAHVEGMPTCQVTCKPMANLHVASQH